VTPFESGGEYFDREETRRRILRRQFTFPNTTMYADARDLISRILVAPDARLSLDQILAHKFCNKKMD